MLTVTRYPLGEARDEVIDSLSRFLPRDKVVSVYGTVTAAIRDEATAAVTPMVLTALIASGIAGLLSIVAIVASGRSKKEP